MTNHDRSQHPTLNDNLDFRKDLANLLKKYNATIEGGHITDLYFTIKNQGTYRLNERGESKATAENINGLEEKPKRERKRKVKNPLRRWIYEYNRYNPQLGCSVRTDEVYAKTQKEAERTAIRHCDDYTAYGSLSFKKLIQVSEPIILDLDVKLEERRYDELRKTYTEYRDAYPKQHSEGWDKLTNIQEA